MLHGFKLLLHLLLQSTIEASTTGSKSLRHRLWFPSNKLIAVGRSVIEIEALVIERLAAWVDQSLASPIDEITKSDGRCPEVPRERGRC